MEIFKESVWVIMSKDRTKIIKGTPRNRSIVEVGKKDKKKFFTFAHKSWAEEAIKRNYGYKDDYEAVEIEMSLITK